MSIDFTPSSQRSNRPDATWADWRPAVLGFCGGLFAIACFVGLSVMSGNDGSDIIEFSSTSKLGLLVFSIIAVSFLLFFSFQNWQEQEALDAEIRMENSVLLKLEEENLALVDELIADDNPTSNDRDDI